METGLLFILFIYLLYVFARVKIIKSDIKISLNWMINVPKRHQNDWTTVVKIAWVKQIGIILPV